MWPSGLKRFTSHPPLPPAMSLRPLRSFCFLIGCGLLAADSRILFFRLWSLGHSTILLCLMPNVFHPSKHRAWSICRKESQKEHSSLECSMFVTQKQNAHLFVSHHCFRLAYLAFVVLLLLGSTEFWATGFVVDRD